VGKIFEAVRLWGCESVSTGLA